MSISRRFTSLVTSLCVVFLFNCSESDPIKLGELELITQVSTDGYGILSVQATSENASYYKYFFGDVPNETPVQLQFSTTSHRYTTSGTYKVTVQAHLSETEFVSKSVDVKIEIFTRIPTGGYSTPTTRENLKLVWNDEFDKSTIDETKWTFENGDGCPVNCGWGNNELQYYQSQNTSILNGNLIIEARNESVNGKNYTSSRVISKGKFDFKYGRVDVRAVLPKGQGMWPAIWMLGTSIDKVGWPQCGEIDIMELVGGGTGKDDKIYGTVHWYENSGVPHASYGGNKTLSSGIFWDNYHVFSITWDQNLIKWYLDDQLYHEISITPAGLSELQENFYLLMNIAVGGNWPGSPNSSTLFPQRLIVDYVRVFQ